LVLKQTRRRGPARERRTALVLFIDELQYVEEEQLAAPITALHRCAQRSLPVTLVCASRNLSVKPAARSPTQSG
jgi:hypothetical protein